MRTDVLICFKPMPLLKRSLLLCLLTLLLLLLESVLQVGSVIVWIGHREALPEKAHSGEKTVLCIGDSFTFGQGSSKREFSYPAQLEGMLREQVDPSWRVVNAGFPGRNSRDLLERIKGQLQAYKPQFVYVMVGINDQWNSPQLLSLAEAGKSGSIALTANSFRWELRIPRLLKWMTGEALTDDSPGPSETVTVTKQEKPPQIPASLIDTWSHPNFKLDIAKSGQVSCAGALLTASVSSDILTLHWLNGESLDLRWQLQGRALRLHAPGWSQPLELQRGNQPPWTLAAKAGAAEAEGDAAGAAVLYRLAIAEAGEKPSAYWYKKLAECLTRLERSDDALEVIDLVRSRADDEDDPSWATALCNALSVVGNREECLATARSYLRRFPDDPFLLQIAGWEGFQSGEEEQGIAAMERAVKLADDTNPAFRRFVRYRLVTMLRSSQPRRTIEAIADLFLQGGPQDQLITAIYNAKDYLDPTVVEETIKTTALTEAEQMELLEVFTTLYSPNDSPFEIVEAHLQQIVILAQQSGATAVLSSYPWFNEQIDAIHGRLQRRTGASRMDMTVAFNKALRTRNRSELFVPDGHCNDRGYGLMAEQVFADLRKRLAR